MGWDNSGYHMVAEAFHRDQRDIWSMWFAWIKKWDNSGYHMQRIIWLKISGVPVQLWDSNVFTIIAGKFGRVLIPQ